MIWLFLTVVLILTVLHRGFRRVMAWLSGGAVVIVAIVFAVIWWRETHQWVPPEIDSQTRGGEVTDPCLLAQLNGPTDTADAKACAQKQKPPPANPLDSLPPPYTGQPVVPCVDLPDNLRAGSNCTNAPWKEYAVPAGYTLDCPAGEIHAHDNVTGMQSCYDPHDAKQLAEHLKECRIDSTARGRARPQDTVAADRRGVSCNVFDQFDSAR